MADSKRSVPLENVQESKSLTEKRKRLGSAVDKSALALALRTSTSTSIEVPDSREIDDVAVQTEDRRKGRLCLGLILGIILLCLLIAGIIMACFLPRSYLLEQEIEELKSQMKSQKKTQAAMDMKIDARVKQLTHQGEGTTEIPSGEGTSHIPSGEGTTQIPSDGEQGEQCPTYKVSTKIGNDDDDNSDNTLIIFSTNLFKIGNDDIINGMKKSLDNFYQTNKCQSWKTPCDEWDSFFLGEQKEYAKTGNWALLQKEWMKNKKHGKGETTEYEIGQICGIKDVIPHEIGLRITGSDDGTTIEEVEVKAVIDNVGTIKGTYPYGGVLDMNDGGPNKIVLHRSTRQCYKCTT